MEKYKNFMQQNWKRKRRTLSKSYDLTVINRPLEHWSHANDNALSSVSDSIEEFGKSDRNTFETL